MSFRIKILITGLPFFTPLWKRTESNVCVDCGEDLFKHRIAPKSNEDLEMG